MNIDTIYSKILIDHFKNPDKDAFSDIYGAQQAGFVKCFKSSGTANRERRSLSFYSQRGLEVYEENSWKHFESVLHHLHPRFKARQWVGLSLIPSSDEWQDSSLSHMVSLFVKKSHWKSRFLRNVADLFSWVENFDVHGSNEPIWVFGTAAHFLSLINEHKKNADQKDLRVVFPQGLSNRVILFETGGFKNIQMDLDRISYLNLISKFFGISSTQIVSEYGMSELASQAYDLASFKYGSEERFFHSSKNMNCYVLQRDGKLSVLGVGCLVVKDESRIDISKFIVTQDVVEIWAPNCFRLLGRVLHSDRRGCSLNVAIEAVTEIGSEVVELVDINSKNEVEFFSSFPEKNILVRYEQRLQSRVNQIDHFFDLLREDSDIYESFLKEFESPFLVSEMLKDLLDCIPKGIKAWNQACIDSGIKENASWLIIPPANHSIAALQVICIALVAGGTLQVRLPKEFDQDGSSLKKMLNFLAKLFPLQLEILGSKYRFVDGRDSGNENVIYLDNSKPKIVFGGDLNFLKSQTLFGNRSKFFGHKMGVSYLHKLQLEQEEDVVHACCHDAFSMLQTGCMSSRYFFVNKDIPEDERVSFLRSLSKGARSYLRGGISAFHGAALDYYAEYVRTKYQADVVMDENIGSTFPLIVLFRKSIDLNLVLEFMEFEKDKAPLCSLAILPIDFSDFVTWISTNETLYYVYTDAFKELKANTAMSSKMVLPLGEAHRIVWDGKHEGKNIFA